MPVSGLGDFTIPKVPTAAASGHGYGKADADNKVDGTVSNDTGADILGYTSGTEKL